VVEVVKVDRKMFLDKIVTLQKKLARKNEKIDFLEDHINHLTEDINKKNRQEALNADHQFNYLLHMQSFPKLVLCDCHSQCKKVLEVSTVL